MVRTRTDSNMDVNDDTFKGDERSGATTAAEIEETTSLVPPELGDRDQQLRVDYRGVLQLEDQLEMLEQCESGAEVMWVLAAAAAALVYGAGFYHGSVVNCLGSADAGDGR